MAVIDFKGISKNYRTVQALRDVSFTVEKGEILGLLGQNGAGKTTLISVLTGLTRASLGAVSVLGHDVVLEGLTTRRLLGVVPQEIFFDPFSTVRETLQNQLGYFGLRCKDGWIEKILSRLGLQEKADTNMRALSGGMKRRVLVAQAIVHCPPVIVLDEPTAGVDVELRQALWAFITEFNRKGHTILLTTHYLEEAQSLCHRIAILKQGRLIALDKTHALLDRWAGLQLVLTVPKANLDFSFEKKMSMQDFLHTLKNEYCPDWLEQNPDFSAIMISVNERQEGLLQLRWHLSHDHQVEPILALCRKHQICIERVDIERANLENVFLKLVADEQGS